MSIGTFLKHFHKILIVEDDAVLRSALVDKFKAKGYKTFEASAAQEVLTLVSSEKPDAIVLDLILPVEDGITLLEELRNGGHTVPVVILSNLLGSDDLRADASRLDAEFYNKSSTSLDEVVEAIEKKI
jgi:DNA-binding response OmpR family regulator